MMKSGGTTTSSPSKDSSLLQLRDIHPPLPRLPIAPLRPSVSHILNVPLPLEPTAGVGHEKNVSQVGASSNAAASSLLSSSSATPLPARLPTLEEFLNAARTASPVIDSVDSASSLEPPPRTILPAFINLRTVEKLPYASFEDNGPVKRRRLDVSGDHFTGEHLQLPVPHTQNEKKPPPPFGPFAILNGLNEPPPNAALFPPIDTGSLPPILTRPMKDVSISEVNVSKRPGKQSSDRREGRLEEILDLPQDYGPETQANRQTRLDREALPNGREGDFGGNGDVVGVPDASEKSPEDSDGPMSPKTRGRSRKKLRKWTDQETNDLLRGVVKCGIGNWTAILAQPELKFNKRSAANLKDRFRVCCPWAYGAADPNEATKQLQTTLANALMNAESTTSGAGGKILLPDPRPVKPAEPAPEPEPSPSSSRLNDPDPVGTQSHGSSKGAPTLSNKSKSTLVSLGIPEPYFTIKSKRRSRRPFTPAEDEALLKGYAVHGFQWTLIQQDKHLNLSHRRATDLRDRFRTKFPHAYREGGSVSGKTIETQRRFETPDQHAANMPAVYSKENLAPNKPPTLPDMNTSLSTEKPRKYNNHAPSPSMRGPIDTALLPPAPPPVLLDVGASTAASGGVFPFLEENPAAGTHVDTTSSSWEDNTLPPLVWDELG